MFNIESVWYNQDVVTENEFEKRLLADVIPPSDIGVTFDDIGALENVKDTLKELVMLPLQRPELFCKGQLTKVCEIPCLYLFLRCASFVGFRIQCLCCPFTSKSRSEECCFRLPSSSLPPPPKKVA